MNTKIISIGNSKGVRIPKNMLNDWDENQEIEIKKIDDKIVIKPIFNSRKLWSKQLDSINDEIDHVDFVENRFDQEEWQWW